VVTTNLQSSQDTARDIIAFAFTDKAAAELRERIVTRSRAELDGAIPSVLAADWMTIQIYHREAEALITGQSTSTGF
jgi:hypothetical protein